MYRMWQLFKRAAVEPNMQLRDKLFLDIIRIHIDEGPFFLGMVANLPNIIIVGNRLKNFPGQKEMPFGGWRAAAELMQPGGVAYPENFYLES